MEYKANENGTVTIKDSRDNEVTINYDQLQEIITIMNNIVPSGPIILFKNDPDSLESLIGQKLKIENPRGTHIWERDIAYVIGQKIPCYYHEIYWEGSDFCYLSKAPVNDDFNAEYIKIDLKQINNKSYEVHFIPHKYVNIPDCGFTLEPID